MANKKLKRYSFILLLMLLFVWGCMPRVVIKEDRSDIRKKVMQLQKKMYPAFDNDIEKEIITGSMYNILYYLEERFGEEKLDRFYRRCLEGDDFASAIREIYGKTFYQLGYEMFMLLDNPDTHDEYPMLSVDMDIFKLYYFPRSRAEQDLPYIRYLLSKYYQELSELYLQNRDVREKLQLILKQLNGNKINVYLFENTKQAKKYFPKFSSTAEVNINSSKVGKKYIPNVNIVTKYYNVLSSTVFVHELTHIIFTISMMPDNLIEELSATGQGSGEKMSKLIKYISQNEGRGLGEGLGEYINEKYSIFYKYNILSDVDEELNFLSCKGVELINLNELLEFRREGGYKNILMMYQEAHSVSGFIIREYGKERFMKLVLSGQSNEDFMSILGVDIETINRKWLSTITCKGKTLYEKEAAIFPEG